jgi:non-specific serine/threonine protein kinase
MGPGDRKDNLQAEATRFIGRRGEASAVATAVARHRLVTLCGPGGIGKTRLARRVARELLDDFPDGCWLVELSALRAPELLPGAVAAALGLRCEAADAADTLAAALAERRLLIVLDTCEHLVTGCAELAETLLIAAPGLRLLATSREHLGHADEHVFPVSPLTLPPDPADRQVADADDWRAAAEGDAVALFLDRAQAAVPGFALTEQNAAGVAELCRRLDGMPLALELAAVRLRVMPVAEIVARLANRFSVLGAARTATSRHRTLRAAIAWSYDLCSTDEQQLWAELSVFPGTFSLDAVEQVCGQGTLEALVRLVEKSAVRFIAGRYDMLNTIREFGAERLGDPGPARVRHRDYYLGLARLAVAGSMTSAQPSWLATLHAEAGNLRTALDFSFTVPGEGEAGLELTTLLRHYWLMTGEFTEGRRWHGAAVRVSPGSAPNAWAVFGAGMLAVQQGDLTAGAADLARAGMLAAELGDEDLAAHVADGRGVCALMSGDMDGARTGHQEALAVYERIGFSDPPALITYARLATVFALGVELVHATRLTEECMRRAEALGEQWARSTALWVRGATRWIAGDPKGAMADALACLRMKEPLGDLHTIAMCFDLLLVCLVGTGNCDRAAVLNGAADELWRLLRAPVLLGPAYAEARTNAASAACLQLGPEKFWELHRTGAMMSLSAAMEVARTDLPLAG